MTDSPRPIGVLDDPLFDRHRSRGHHPERPERLVAARAGVARAAVPTRALTPRDVAPEELVRVHSPEYVDDLTRLAGREGHLDADTYLSAGSIPAAMRAAGGACALVDAMIDGEIDRGVALLRPPGHHARPGQAMGFCLLNNIAVAAAQARARGVERVAIVDWDVHHGNGTQEMFLRDPSVLYVSLHQWPFYPGSGMATETGADEGRGATVNVPMSPGAGDAEYAAAFERIVAPVLDQFEPELLLVSAGYDAHRSDPLASMRLDAGSYARFTTTLVGLAERHAKGRIALVLEGGYDLSALEASLAASVRALAGKSVVLPEADAPGAVYEVELERARKMAGKRWRV